MESHPGVGALAEVDDQVSGHEAGDHLLLQRTEEQVNLVNQFLGCCCSGSSSAIRLRPAAQPGLHDSVG